MSRKFEACTPAFFKAKLEELECDEGPLIANEDGWASLNLDAFPEKVWKDLKKVEFDFENYAYTEAEAYSGSKSIIGFQVHGNGMPYFGVVAGGDWEMPVFFIIYWDGKNLRGYVPTDGNIWNTDCKSAYGNNDDKDPENMKKRWPELFNDGCDDINIDDCPDCDPVKIVNDIGARIISGPAAEDEANALEEKLASATFLTAEELMLLSKVYIRAMENTGAQYTDWEEVCEVSKKDLDDLYYKLNKSGD